MLVFFWKTEFHYTYKRYAYNKKHTFVTISIGLDQMHLDALFINSYEFFTSFC